VELAVEDEQAVEDLKLLIKLSYSTSFTHDGGQLLPFDTRLRLAARADSLEFVEAVDQVVPSLALGLDFEKATTCLAAVPAALEEHPGMEAVRKQMAALLIKGIEERDADTSEESKPLAQRGGGCAGQAPGARARDVRWGKDVFQGVRGDFAAAPMRL
jgi:hypothetical protein